MSILRQMRTIFAYVMFAGLYCFLDRPPLAASDAQAFFATIEVDGGVVVGRTGVPVPNNEEHHPIYLPALDGYIVDGGVVVERISGGPDSNIPRNASEGESLPSNKFKQGK